MSEAFAEGKQIEFGTSPKTRLENKELNTKWAS